MPLPDAGNPDDSIAYQQLAGKQIGPTNGVTVDELETVFGPLYLDRNSEDELRRQLLIGHAASRLSSSGPIAGTMASLNTAVTSASATVWNTNDNHNAVWQIVGASIGGISTGTSRVRLFLQDVETNVSVLVASLTAGDTQFELNEPIYVNYPVRLLATPTGYTSGSTDIRVAAIRVR